MLGSDGDLGSDNEFSVTALFLLLLLRVLDLGRDLRKEFRCLEALRIPSYVTNCCLNAGLGLTMERQSLVCFIACSRVQEKCFIAKAMTVLADLDIPILQWTRHTPDLCTQSLMNL